MTDEMKLLRAFIEAQGYEIKEVKTEYISMQPDRFVENQFMTIDYKVTKKDIDYKLLLEKYIDHVSCCEGYDFISEAVHDFSPEEFKALKDCKHESN